MPKAKGKRKAEDRGDSDEQPVEETSHKKNKKSSSTKASGNSSDTKQQKEEASRLGNFKIVSWNINGLRAWVGKKGVDYLEQEDADIICLQETKCPEDKLPKEIEKMKKNYPFQYYSDHSDKKGYAGVAVLSKKEPVQVVKTIGVDEHDVEGRVVALEMAEFFLVNVYVPNSGRGLPRLGYRMKWDEDFKQFLKNLEKQKPVILCGDLNVAHKPIDLKNPDKNTKTAGFTKEERENFTKFLAEGFVDSFRQLYPNKSDCFTFWSYLSNSRAKNIGWRLDYFVLSEQLIPKLCDNQIHDDVLGSDHCPIVLHLQL